jgi:hypothetical protein
MLIEFLEIPSHEINKDHITFDWRPHTSFNYSENSLKTQDTAIKNIIRKKAFNTS